jgi:hypothetical protein
MTTKRNSKMKITLMMTSNKIIPLQSKIYIKKHNKKINSTKSHKKKLKYNQNKHQNYNNHPISLLKIKYPSKTTI